MTLARQREGRVIASQSGFRPRSMWTYCEPQKDKPVHDARTRPLEASRAYRALVPRNNERGMQCRGQGCRHQNPPAYAQPGKAGGRQAKWANPNPKAGAGRSSAAVKACKNFKQVQ